MKLEPEDIIIEPLLTEKSNVLKERHVFVFKVHILANKIQIKQAIQKLYGVTPLSCRTITVHGKTKRQGRFVGKTSSFKKAIITLKQGDSISIFEGA